MFGLPIKIYLDSWEPKEISDKLILLNKNENAGG